MRHHMERLATRCGADGRSGSLSGPASRPGRSWTAPTDGVFDAARGQGRRSCRGSGPGLGQANARALAREGATVVLAARNADYLAEVQKEIEARRRAGPSPCRPTSSTPSRSPALVDAHGRRVRPPRRARQQRVPHGHVPAVRRGRPHEVAQDLRGQRVGRARPHPGVHPAPQGGRRRARRRVDRVHHLDEHAQDPRARGRLLVVEGRGPDRGEDDGGRARPDRRARQLRRAGLDRRAERRDVHRDGVRRARHLARRRARRDRGAHPARPHPAAGRHRELASCSSSSPWSRVVTGQTLDVNGGEWIG